LERFTCVYDARTGCLQSQLTGFLKHSLFLNVTYTALFLKDRIKAANELKHRHQDPIYDYRPLIQTRNDKIMIQSIQLYWFNDVSRWIGRVSTL